LKAESFEDQEAGAAIVGELSDDRQRRIGAIAGETGCAADANEVLHGGTVDNPHPLVKFHGARRLRRRTG
jgi:hypothetical protein